MFSFEIYFSLSNLNTSHLVLSVPSVLVFPCYGRQSIFIFSLNVRLCGAYLKMESSGLSSFPALDRLLRFLPTIFLPAPSFPRPYSVTSCQHKSHGIVPILLNSSSIMCSLPVFTCFLPLYNKRFGKHLQLSPFLHNTVVLKWCRFPGSILSDFEVFLHS